MRYAIKHLRNYSKFSILKRYALQDFEHILILNTVFTSLETMIYDMICDV